MSREWINKDNYKIISRRFFLVAYDICISSIAAIVALIIRYDFRYDTIAPEFLESVIAFIPYGMLITITTFYLLRLYHSLWAFAGVTEMQNVVIACMIASLLQGIGLHLLSAPVPRSYYFIYAFVLLGGTVSSRFCYRLVRGMKHKKQNKKNGIQVMLIGAGEAGNVIIKEIVTSAFSRMIVRCIIDDDPNKWGKYIQGIRITGGRDKIIENVNFYGINEIIIAMPIASKKVIRELIEICQETDCTLRTLPGMYQLVNGEINVSKLRNVEVEDLLGREPVSVDIDSILEYVQDKKVLVTGGGGSIGSELCRQIASHNPKELIVVDIYENAAYDLQQELVILYPDLQLSVLVASVRNTNRINSIFEMYRPEIVYHAAAHKHVPLMETSPNEAIKNNVFGTFKTAYAAASYGTKKFVMISTDKAVNPTNIMGASKRLCEMIIQIFNNNYATEFVAVRFGNVLGSNGSVIPVFQRQIEAGGPVTVTHPDIIRYFMTIPEAVSLVLQAGAFARGGEIFVLDMGEPVKIYDLAKNLIRLSGYKVNEDIKIEFTGLRPGEKLYEELLMEEEGLKETANKMIHIGKPIEMDERNFFKNLSELKNMANGESPKIRDKVKEMVVTYHEVESKER